MLTPYKLCLLIIRSIIVCGLLISPAMASTSITYSEYQPTDVSMVITVGSRHIGVDRDVYNEQNYGLGITWRYAGNRYGLGMYKNSYDDMSSYGYMSMLEYKSSHKTTLGIEGGFVTGYREATILPLLTGSIEYQHSSRYASRLIIMPSLDSQTKAVLGYQFFLKLH